MGASNDFKWKHADDEAKPKRTNETHQVNSSKRSRVALAHNTVHETNVNVLAEVLLEEAGLVFVAEAFSVSVLARELPDAIFLRLLKKKVRDLGWGISGRNDVRLLFRKEQIPRRRLDLSLCRWGTVVW